MMTPAQALAVAFVLGASFGALFARLPGFLPLVAAGVFLLASLYLAHEVL